MSDSKWSNNDHDLLIELRTKMDELLDRPHGMKLWAQIGGVIVAAQVAISMLAKIVAAFAVTGAHTP